MAFSRARARTARRLCRGPGPGHPLPTWADLGPIIASHSSGSNGYALLPIEQNWHLGETLAPTNPHARSLFRALHRRKGATAGPAMGGG
jgi:hypothetical protein